MKLLKFTFETSYKIYKLTTVKGIREVSKGEFEENLKQHGFPRKAIIKVIDNYIEDEVILEDWGDYISVSTSRNMYEIKLLS